MQNSTRIASSALFLLCLVPVVGLTGTAQAQDKPHHESIIHRHPNASAAVAGVAAHHYAKTRKHGIMHRHPVATGIAAAAVTHHYAKKRRHHRHSN